MVDYVKGGGALCAGNAVALLVFGPVMLLEKKLSELYGKQ